MSERFKKKERLRVGKVRGPTPLTKTDRKKDKASAVREAKERVNSQINAVVNKFKDKSAKPLKMKRDDISKEFQATYVTGRISEEEWKIYKKERLVNLGCDRQEWTAVKSTLSNFLWEDGGKFRCDIDNPNRIILEVKNDSGYFLFVAYRDGTYDMRTGYGRSALESGTFVGTKAIRTARTGNDEEDYRLFGRKIPKESIKLNIDLLDGDTGDSNGGKT